MIKIKLSSVSIDDYDKALEFYTEKLGFVKKQQTGWKVNESIVRFSDFADAIDSECGENSNEE